MANEFTTISESEMQAYLARGRAERSKAAHTMFTALGAAFAEIFSNSGNKQLSHG